MYFVHTISWRDEVTKCMLRIETKSNKHYDNTPWFNAYIENCPEDITLDALSVVKVSKGLIINTELFKCFLFKDSSIYKFLLEALSEWIMNSSIAFPLVVIVEDEEFSLGIDDSRQPVIWIQEGKTYQVKKKKQTSKALIQQKNPFIISPPTTTKVTKEVLNAYTPPTTTTSH